MTVQIIIIAVLAALIFTAIAYWIGNLTQKQSKRAQKELDEIQKSLLETQLPSWHQTSVLRDRLLDIKPVFEAEKQRQQNLIGQNDLLLYLKRYDYIKNPSDVQVRTYVIPAGQEEKNLCLEQDLKMWFNIEGYFFVDSLQMNCNSRSTTKMRRRLQFGDHYYDLYAEGTKVHLIPSLQAILTRPLKGKEASNG